MEIALKILIIAWFFESVGDVISTNGFLARGVPEGGWLSGKLQKWCGPLWWIPKMLIVLALLALSWFLHVRFPSPIMGWILVGVLAAACVRYAIAIRSNLKAGT